MWKRHCLLLIVLLLAGSTPASGETTTLPPSDDMYTDPNHAIPPTLGELWVANYAGAEHYERINMRFDLSGFRAEVESATLHLYRFFRCPSHYYTATQLFAATVPWNENTWPVATHLPHEDTPRLAFTFGPDLGWYEIDLTDLVQEWIDGATPNYGFVIEADWGEKWSKFYSKDSAEYPSLAPYLVVETAATGVGDDAPAAALAAACFPNPFNPRTTVAFTLPAAGRADLRVFDSLGHLVRVLRAEPCAAGRHEAAWDGCDEKGRAMPSGLYFYRLDTDHGCRQGKMLMAK